MVYQNHGKGFMERWCGKIPEDSEKGLRSCPIMLNAGRSAAEPGDRRISPLHNGFGDAELKLLH